nr:MAG TPA: hypothetical protein [Caudoviricetes sp.]
MIRENPKTHRRHIVLRRAFGFVLICVVTY